MMKKILLSAIIITCIFRTQASAASIAGVVEKGNRLYYDQKYQDASKYYDQALAQQPDSAVINFDSGAAQYQIKEYQKANSLFEKSLITEDKSLEAKANYNLGNSKYMLGLSKENTELSVAVQLLEGALNNYKRTQELTPKDEDVKVNYKIVQEKLKELKEKLKQQTQENREQKTEDGEQNQEKKKAEELKNESSKEQEQFASAQPPEPKEMSKEEANMLLEGCRQEENTAGMLKDDRKGTEEKVLKDW
ncbi:MAG: hypothetical protein Q8O41_11445 [Candidatus Methanoperedens sp.]|nr:hypothetical protein [Candidatus Methanoperedens sp.]